MSAKRCLTSRSWLMGKVLASMIWVRMDGTRTIFEIIENESYCRWDVATLQKAIPISNRWIWILVPKILQHQPKNIDSIIINAMRSTNRAWCPQYNLGESPKCTFDFSKQACVLKNSKNLFRSNRYDTNWIWKFKEKKLNKIKHISNDK